MPRRIAVNQKVWRRTTRVDSFKHVNYTRIENPQKVRKKFLFFIMWLLFVLSLLVVRRFDDDAAQRISLCRRMWLLSPKAEAQTRPHTVQADPCRVVVGCGWLCCWCLRARFATATSICCCSKVASPLWQTARHSSRSPANSSSLSKGIPHLLKDDLM